MVLSGQLAFEPAEMAAAHGSVGLLRRCEHDLARRGVRVSSPGVLPAD